MQRFSTEEASRSVLRALQTIAMANGIFDEAERTMLRVVAKLYEVDLPGEIPSISGAALAEAVPLKERRKALQDCVLMALADHDASPEEWKVLQEYATNLDISEDELRSFYDHGVALRALEQHEQERRHVGAFLQELSELKGQKGLEIFFRQHLNIENPATAWRYRQLGLLPERTLGRELYIYCRTNRFGFPGEVGGLPEPLIWHDLLHALTGYAANPLGEVLLAAFTAGVVRKDPFPYLFLALLPLEDFPPLVGLQSAYARGLSATENFVADWDFWSDVTHPVQEVQAKYGAL